MSVPLTSPQRLPVRAVERPWGGHGLPQLGLLAPGSAAIGEYWLPTDRFPLLVKVIDARERLSIQLHPDDATAHALGLPSGKTECWYILDARPGAELWLGLRDGMSDQEFLDRAERGEDVSSLLVRYVPLPGETYFVPAGTVHAIGGGLTVLEVQQPADVTFRVFDWNRKPARKLHLAQARAAIRARTAARQVAPVAVERTATHELIACEFFALRELTAPRGGPIDGSRAAEELWFVRSGRGRLRSPGTPSNDTEIAPGTFLLMPRASESLHWEPASDGSDPALRLVRMAVR